MRTYRIKKEVKNGVARYHPQINSLWAAFYGPEFLDITENGVGFNWLSDAETFIQQHEALTKNDGVSYIPYPVGE